MVQRMRTRALPTCSMELTSAFIPLELAQYVRLRTIGEFKVGFRSRFGRGFGCGFGIFETKSALESKSWISAAQYGNVRQGRSESQTCITRLKRRDLFTARLI